MSGDYFEVGQMVRLLRAHQLNPPVGSVGIVRANHRTEKLEENEHVVQWFAHPMWEKSVVFWTEEMEAVDDD